MGSLCRRDWVWTFLIVFGCTAAHEVAAQTPIDLRTWTMEAYSELPSQGVPIWDVAIDGSSVVELENAAPSIFFGDFTASEVILEGDVEVRSGAGDDDLFGFALGLRPGFAIDPTARFVLVDWKRRTQRYDFLGPSCTPGGDAIAGLAAVRVSGVPTADELWTHRDFDSPACSPVGQGVAPLVRASTLGATGWVEGRVYRVRIELCEAALELYVDGVLELALTSVPVDGRFGFYDFSQRDATYFNWTTVPCGAVCFQEILQTLGNSLRMVKVGGTRDLHYSWIEPLDGAAYYHALSACGASGYLEGPI